jgi:hypothetical protein
MHVLQVANVFRDLPSISLLSVNEVIFPLENLKLQSDLRKVEDVSAHNNAMQWGYMIQVTFSMC